LNPLVVVDVSVVLTWCFEDEATPASLALLDQLKTRTIVVPALWHVELANALIQGERRGRINAEAVAEFSALIRDLRVRTDHGLDQDGPVVLFRLAREHRLTGYDAAYLEVALRLRASLATRDGQLRDAATRAGVDVVPI
jgi:predicted nucleic acid-binding protein